MPPTNYNNNPTTDMRAAHWRGVFFDGPAAAQAPDGDEIPVWTVYIGNEEAEPRSTVYRCYAFDAAQDLAQRMAQDRNLELVQDAMPA